MLFVGLTGAIGSGKSEAVRILSRSGVPVFSTDAAAHRLLRSASMGRRLTRRFGPGLWRRGRVDRSLLAEKVFADDLERRWLEKLLHPAIRREVLAWKKALRARRRPPALAVVEVPLLHECGWRGLFDGVLCVTVPDAVRRRRLRGRGWSQAQTARRERLQWTGERKARSSDWRLSNQGNLGDLSRRLDQWRRSVTTGRLS